MGRFASLVETLEKKEAFKAKYNIPARVTIEYCELGDWYTRRKTEDIVITMIAIIEGGMRFLMDRVMRDFLNFFRLCPT